MRCQVERKCLIIMNFFNDSFNSLKSALEEKINNFEDPEKEFEENENLRKLVQHQNDEVNY